MKFHIFFLFIILCFYSCSPAPRQTDVLVIGAGASGTPAAIQAARLGAKVILVDETPWLGGMLTAAGVPATDGNHKLPSGIWGEFRQKLRDHYGGPDSVFTGWVSNTLFEPHIGNQFWNEIADGETNLERIHGYHVVEVIKLGSQVQGAVFENEAGVRMSIEAKVIIEATELGDVLELAGVEFFTGQNTPENPHDDNIQDLTYTAIFKDFGPNADMSIPKPDNYNPEEFDCICKEVCDDPEKKVPNCDFFLEYGKLPNDKYMMNWPNNGNDYFLNPIPLSFSERKQAYIAAKNRTLSLLYFLQQEVGYKNLGLADDEFPTEDYLPFIPYHRESRRGKGEIQLMVKDLTSPYEDPNRAFYKEAIAVGDYPLDHHHDKNTNADEESYPPLPSFSIPYRSLIPEKVDGLIMAEKSISATHLVSGASRLQPCVMLIGQAAGAAAALSVKTETQLRDLSIKKIQQTLLNANCWLLPFIDTNPDDWGFQALQKAGVFGLIQGHGVPYKWANQTWIYPDTTVSLNEFAKMLGKVQDKNPIQYLVSPGEIPSNALSREETILGLAKILHLSQKSLAEVLVYFDEKGWLNNWADKNNFQPEKEITRQETVWLLDEIFHFF